MPAPLVGEESGIQDVFRSLIQDSARNRRIAQDIRSAFSSGRNILVLTERTAHIEYLKTELNSSISPCFVLHGRLPRKQRESVLAEIAALPESTPHVILATGRLVGEGFDHPRLDMLVLAMPISWKGTLQQYAGRLHRDYAAKTDVQIYDYVEEANPRLFRMWEKRRRGYEAMGYRIRIQEELF